MNYFIDCEFIEYPCTIDLISIALVREDGRFLYRINNEFDASKANDWVKENVINKLPKTSNCYASKEKIKQDILNFIEDDEPIFYGYYADYDWVVFCWLFGTMMDLPKNFPRYCRDIKQTLDEKGNPKIPIPVINGHDALCDAIWIMSVYNWIKTL